MHQATQAHPFSPRFLVLAGMIVLAVATRLVVAFLPGALPWNFTPIEAIALFGGAYFSDRRVAVIVPLAAMFLSDLIIGLHDMIPVVYSCIALTTLLGYALRGRVSALRVSSYAIISALMFFAITNGVEWVVGGTEFCRAGLVSCYVAGLPFLKGTLAGTLIWSALLFGGFELLRRQWPVFEARAA